MPSQPDITATIARQLAARYAGNHRVIIEPGSAAQWRSASRDGKPDRAGVRFDLTFLDGPAKGERLDFRLVLEGAPKRVCGADADILVALAEATGAEGATSAELVNSAARELFPTTKNPTPPPVTATITASIVEGSSRPFLNLKALVIGGGND